MKNVIFIAPPGAGKGTFSNMLEEKLGYLHLSAGEILREEKRSGSELGKEIANVIDKGQLVNHTMLKRLMLKKLKSIPYDKPLIIDGYPRTIEQTEDYEQIVKELGIDSGVVIYLDVDKDVLEKRCLGRYSCLKCDKTYNIFNSVFKPKTEGKCDICNCELTQRDDDTKEGFNARYNNYLKETIPVLEYFKENQKVVQIDGTLPIDKIYEEIKSNIGS